MSSFVVLWFGLSSFVVVCRRLSSFVLVYRRLSWFVVVCHGLIPRALSGRTCNADHALIRAILGHMGFTSKLAAHVCGAIPQAEEHVTPDGAIKARGESTRVGCWMKLVPVIDCLSDGRAQLCIVLETSEGVLTHSILGEEHLDVWYTAQLCQ